MRLLSLLVVCVFSLVVCQAAFAVDKASDDALYDKVRQKLANDRDVKGGGIDVDVKDGVVTLRGKVHEEKQKSKAEKVAKKVKGVVSVVNQLEVETVAKLPPSK